MSIHRPTIVETEVNNDAERKRMMVSFVKVCGEIHERPADEWHERLGIYAAGWADGQNDMCAKHHFQEPQGYYTNKGSAPVTSATGLVPDSQDENERAIKEMTEEELEMARGFNLSPPAYHRILTEAQKELQEMLRGKITHHPGGVRKKRST